MRFRLICLLTAALALLLAGSAGAGESVTISGRAYEFNHMDRFIEGATIRVRERPRLRAVTAANGDYVLEVPDDATVTPYIDPPEGYNEIDLQTFHTRGDDIVNANFQTPADLEYNALAALLGAVRSGRAAAGVRDRDDRLGPQRARRRLPDLLGAHPPRRRRRDVRRVPRARRPDLLQRVRDPRSHRDHRPPRTAASSGPSVPAGTYRIATLSPTTRFASFLASCEPGRIVNANPPWGAYELSAGEKPLGAGSAVADVGEPKLRTRANGSRRLRVSVDAGERLTRRAVLKDRAGKTLGRVRGSEIGAGKRTISFRLPSDASGRATLTILFRDAAGGKAKVSRRAGSASEQRRQLPARLRRRQPDLVAGEVHDAASPRSRGSDRARGRARLQLPSVPAPRVGIRR